MRMLLNAALFLSNRDPSTPRLLSGVFYKGHRHVCSAVEHHLYISVFHMLKKDVRLCDLCHYLRKAHLLFFYLTLNAALCESEVNLHVVSRWRCISDALFLYILRGCILYLIMMLIYNHDFVNVANKLSVLLLFF